MEQLFYLPETMIWPLAACLVLTGIHVYLGVHVIARRVIFVDLALAQIAALGTVTGVLLGFEVGKDVNALYFYSLAFTIFGAFIFSITRMKGEKVPHEAVIGIVYAVTFAATMLVLSRSALGPQELDHIIKGELLWVQYPTVIKTAIIYSLVGLFHFIFRKKFMAISFDPAGAEAAGIKVRLWDFLFYMSFGFVITSSVAIAGVFLVFSYLVIPSVGAMLISDKLSTRLASGWIGGSIISFVGVKLSWNTGLPTSPLIVVLFAAALLLSGVVYYFRVSERKFVALRNIAAAAAVVLIFFGGLLFFRKAQEDPLEHTMHLLSSPLSTDRQAGIHDLYDYLDKRRSWLPTVIDRLTDPDAAVRKDAVSLLMRVNERSAAPHVVPLLDDPSDDVQLAAVQALKTFGDTSASAKLLAKGKIEDDPEMKTTLLKASLELGNPAAIPELLRLIKDGGIFADDAYDALRGHIPFQFRKEEYEKALQWWQENRDRLRWNPGSKEFMVA